MKENVKMNARKRKITVIIFFLLLVPIAYVICHFSDIKTECLKMTINHTLKDKYGEEFKCISISIDGGAIKYVSYPQSDQSLHFDGLVGSYDTYPGAIISNDDSIILGDYMSTELGDVYVYGMPSVKSNSELTHMINVGRRTADELRAAVYNPRKYFYVILNVSSSPKRTFEDEYDMIMKSTNELIEYYKRNYNMDIVVDLNINFVNQKEYDFSKIYFQTHVGTDFEFNSEICSLPIVMEIGKVDDFSVESWIVSKEEYVIERKDILERYGR